MRFRSFRPLAAAALMLAGPSLLAAQEEPPVSTVEQAQELSQQTGRPILAMAGSKN